MMKELLLVGSGSFIGGILRYLIYMFIKFDGTHFPYATFLVNIIGCFFNWHYLFNIHKKQSVIK